MAADEALENETSTPGDGGVGVGYLRKRYDAYDIDNDDKTQDDKERRLFARLIVLGGFARGAVIASTVRGGLLGRIAVCLALLTLLALLVRALRSVWPHHAADRGSAR